MAFKTGLIAGLGIGYVLGARSGLRVVQRGVEKAGTAVRDRLHTGELAEDVVNLVEEQSGVAPEKADRSGTQVFRTEGTVK
jgi:hypothetical protein